MSLMVFIASIAVAVTSLTANSASLSRDVGKVLSRSEAGFAANLQYDRMVASYSTKKNCDCDMRSGSLDDCADDYYRQNIAFVDGVDDRKKVIFQDPDKSIGRIKCDKNKQAFDNPRSEGWNGTGTIVVPKKPNDKRKFETLITVKHVLLNEDGSPAYCEFIPGADSKLGSFPISIPSNIGPLPSADLSGFAKEIVYVDIPQRLTACETQACRSSQVSTSRSLNLVPLKVTSLSKEDLKALKSQNAFDLVGAKTNFMRAFGYKKGVGMLSVSGESKSKDYDEECVDRGFAPSELVSYHGCDSSGGQSGGPNLRDITFPDGSSGEVIDRIHVGALDFANGVLPGADGPVRARSGERSLNVSAVVTPVHVNELQSRHDRASDIEI